LIFDFMNLKLVSAGRGCCGQSLQFHWQAGETITDGHLGKMLMLLEEKKQAMGINSIRTVHGRWEDD
jgi:hypothetical protein